MSHRRARTLVRDHPGLNPYLRHLAIPSGTPVYWYPDGQLLQYSETGEAQRIPVATSALMDWMSGHDPDELWEPWRGHLRGQRVLIEHTSVNPVHPLHVGSMRGTVIGSTLVELFRSAGADVHTRYFVNDLGRQLHILQRATVAARWDNIPTGHRYDDIIGVLYAFANMTLAGRTTDLDRLTTTHPWLAEVIDLHAPLPAPVPAPEVVEAMLAAAVSDMGQLGAKIDLFEYETDLTIQPGALIATLADRCDLVRINGTTCLRLPAGVVPAQRGDGSLLYISRDIANTHHRNPPAWSAMLHVIGADQTLLQAALRHAVPHAALEHVAFGQISRAGRRYSARQNRLTTINDLLQEGGQKQVHELALALALHRRTRPIDLAHLDTTRPLRTVITAAHAVPRTGGDTDRELLRRLMIALLGTPAVLARDIDRRTIHGTARHLLLLSRHYLAAIRTGSVPDTVCEWFRHTQTRLAALLGITLLAPETASAPERSTPMTEPFNIGYADAQVYEDMLPPHYYHGREDIDLVRDHLHNVYRNHHQHNDLRVLDLGCGPGRVTSVLAAYADTLTGTDKSSGMIAQFRSRFPDAEAHCVDTETVVAQFAEQHRRFDLIGSFWSMSYPLLECFETTTSDGVTVTSDLETGTARAHTLITHLIDLLAPGGRLVMLFFDAATPEQRLVTRLWERIHPFPGTGRDFTWKLLLRELHDAEAAGRGQLTTRRLPGIAVTPNIDAAIQWFRIGHLNNFTGLADDPEVVAEITDFARAHQHSDGRVLIPSGVHLVDFHASTDPTTHLPPEFR